MDEPPLPSPPPSRQLHLHQTLDVLLSWARSTVHVSAEPPERAPVAPFWIRGPLGMDPRLLGEHYGSDEFQFTVGDVDGRDRYPGGFGIQRRCFAEATLVGDDRLIIELREDDDERQYKLSLHIVRHTDPPS